METMDDICRRAMCYRVEIMLMLQYKRPIMSINSGVVSSSEQLQCQSKLQKLHSMLALNRTSQAKLTRIKDRIARRMQVLEEVGVLEPVKPNPIFDADSPINEVRRMPALLEDQMLLKKNSSQEFGFLKNMIQEKQTKTKKIKPSRFDELSIVNMGPDPRAINFVEKAEKYGKVGLQLYKEWREIHRKKPQNKIISIDEGRLAEKRKIYGDNWQKIGYYFNGLTFENLYYYYQKNLSRVESGKWTLRQSLMLIILVQYYGVGKWALISKKIKVKSQFQIRQRFCNVLDPTIKENIWSHEDQKLLLQVAYDKKYKWSNIVKTVPQFSNKTDNALRRKFRNLMIKKDDEQICRQIRNKKLQESILKFKKNYYNRSKRAPTATLINKKQQEDESD